MLIWILFNENGNASRTMLFRTKHDRVNRKRLSIVRNEGTVIGRVNIGSVCQNRGLSREGEGKMVAHGWHKGVTLAPCDVISRRGVKSGVKERRAVGAQATREQHTGREG